MIRAIIVDDERLARERISEMLAQHSEAIEIVGTASLGSEAVLEINRTQPDLVFLDIHLPDMSGFDVLDKIDNKPWIIFTTAYEQYAVRAFENLSLDYLVKPIAQFRFDAAIEKLNLVTQQKSIVNTTEIKELMTQLSKKKQPISLTIKKGDKYLLVDFDDIAFLKSEDKYINVCLLDGTVYLLDRTLTELTTKLSDAFIRVHRSYVINRHHILEMEKYFKGTLILTMNNKTHTKIKTGQSYSKEVKMQLGL